MNLISNPICHLNPKTPSKNPKTRFENCKDSILNEFCPDWQAQTTKRSKKIPFFRQYQLIGLVENAKIRFWRGKTPFELQKSDWKRQKLNLKLKKLDLKMQKLDFLCFWLSGILVKKSLALELVLPSLLIKSSEKNHHIFNN